MSVMEDADLRDACGCISSSGDGRSLPDENQGALCGSSKSSILFITEDNRQGASLAEGVDIVFDFKGAIA